MMRKPEATSTLVKFEGFELDQSSNTLKLFGQLFEAKREVTILLAELILAQGNPRPPGFLADKINAQRTGRLLTPSNVSAGMINDARTAIRNHLLKLDCLPSLAGTQILLSRTGGGFYLSCDVLVGFQSKPPINGLVY
jgi:hypothetical protein